MKKNLLLLVIIGSTLTAMSQNISRYNINRIQPWIENSRFWQYKGKPVMLLGASDDDNLFQWEKEMLIPHLTEMQKSGVNYLRNTMSGREDKGFEIQAFFKTDEGMYDLNQWNDAYWTRLNSFLKETAKRNMIVQIELWDRFDYSQQHWQYNPYNPKNNITYTSKESGLNEHYPDHPGSNKQPFFFTTPKQRNNPTLLAVQERYIEKLLSYTLQYGNVLYCIDNETSGEENWSIYWRDFITTAAQKKGKEICVTEMWDDWNLLSPTHKRTFDYPQRYQFVELSQNTHQIGKELWNNLSWVANYIDESPRPMNIVKTYGSDYGKHGSTSQAIERWWLHLLGGVAAVRFHRPDSGLGFSALSAASVKAARKLEDIVNYWDLKADNQFLINSNTSPAYLSYKPDEVYLIFLPNGGSTKLKMNDYQHTGSINYLNLRSGEWLLRKPGEITLGSELKITAPDNNQWVVVINRIKKRK